MYSVQGRRGDHTNNNNDNDNHENAVSFYIRSRAVAYSLEIWEWSINLQLSHSMNDSSQLVLLGRHTHPFLHVFIMGISMLTFYYIYENLRAQLTGTYFFVSIFFIVKRKELSVFVFGFFDIKKI